MLFHSHVFLFVFLPLVLLGHGLLRRYAPGRWAVGWLVLASLGFYAWWDPSYLPLLLGSLGFNYSCGAMIARRRGSPVGSWLLALGVAANLALLGYFKYANFLVDVAGDLSGRDWSIAPILLPIGISFFTFQKVAYLVDAHQGKPIARGFLDYCFFVTFFPQLIAGPIVHHQDIFPQLEGEGRRDPRAERFAVAFSLFGIGLFKKVVLADALAPYADTVFHGFERGLPLSGLEAWVAALSYSLQLYFDFSGYSDMAVGLGCLFGIRLPLNFDSPYKARSLIDFWRRWHITLSRFLRDYVYIPLGGSRAGGGRRHVNLFLTMLLGGAWHGAGWTFIVWGAWHGFWLTVNHALKPTSRIRIDAGDRSRWRPSLGLLGPVATFLVVVLGWVLFRAESIGSAGTMLGAMFGIGGGSWWAERASGENATLYAALRVALGLAIVWTLPNTGELFRRYRPALVDHVRREVWSGRRARLAWRPTWIWGLAVAIMLVWAVAGRNDVSAFLYYQF